MFAKPMPPALHDAHPLGQGLAGAWLFTEGNGTRATDLSRQQTHGVLQLAPVWTPANFGSSLTLNGTTQYIQLVSNVAPASVPAGLGNLAAANTGYSFSAWIKTTASAAIGAGTPWTNNNNIIEGRTTGASGTVHAWSFGVEGGKLATGRSNNISGATGQRPVSTASVNDNAWHHAAVTVDVNACALYIDGKLDSTTTFSAAGATGDFALSTGTAAAYVQIGARTTNAGAATNFWQGGLDHLLIWNRALSDQSVRQLYADSFAAFRRPARMRRFVMPGAALPATARQYAVGIVA